MATEVITINREERDVLQDAIRSHMTGQLEGFNETLRCGSRAEVREQRDLIDHICSLLEEMDWDDEDKRDAYQLTVDLDEFLSWLREQRSDIQDSIEYELDGLAHQEAGDPDHMFIGSSQSESIAKTRVIIAEDRHDLAVFSALLDQFEPAEAVA